MCRLLESFFDLTLVFILTRPASNTIRIYYAGPEDNSVDTALTLAPKGTFTFVTDPSQADVFVLNGTIPNPAAIAAQVSSRCGLVLHSWPGSVSRSSYSRYWAFRSHCGTRAMPSVSLTKD